RRRQDLLVPDQGQDRSLRVQLHQQPGRTDLRRSADSVGGSARTLALQPAPAVNREIDQIVGGEIVEAVRLRAANQILVHAVDAELEQLVAPGAGRAASV